MSHNRVLLRGFSTYGTRSLSVIYGRGSQGQTRYTEPSKYRWGSSACSMKPQVLIVDRKPTVEEYIALTTSVGWSKYVTPATANVALANTPFAVVAEQAGDAVGMGRIVGDGALFLYIQDVLVIPALQRCGVGHTIMARLMSWLDKAAPDRAFVGLFSASGRAAFYERYGSLGIDSDE